MKTATHSTSPREDGGFSRTDLLALLAAGGLLTSLFLGAVSRAGVAESRSVCLQRLSLLARAMTMFAMDNRDLLPPNPDDGNVTPGHNWCAGQAGVGGAQEFNPDILRDPSRALLAPYLNAEIWMYRCPDDPRLGRYQGADPSLRGQVIPSARTVSLNHAVGTNPLRPGQPVDGPWLDANHGHTANRTWYCYGKITDFIRPGPAQTFTFIEEDHRSLNDSAFASVGPSPQQSFRMVDWPGTYHDASGAVAFADGHVAVHRWVDPRTIITGGFVGAPTHDNSPDVVWIAQRASALIRE